MTPHLRIQFACGGRLVAECLVEGFWEADRVTAKYLSRRNALGLPMGSSLTSLATLPRFWNVPVGESVLMNVEAVLR